MAKPIINVLRTIIVLVVAGLTGNLASGKETDLLLHHFVVTENHTHTNEHVELPYHQLSIWSVSDNNLDSLVPNYNCFRLVRSLADQTDLTLSVHFSFTPEDEQRRTLLFANTTRWKVDFCLDDYIYLNRMHKFHLYLSTEGKLQNEEQSMQVSLYRVLKSASPHALVQPLNGSATLSGGWFFYSSQAVLSFLVPEVNVDKRFFVCDIVNHCEAMQKEEVFEFGKNQTLFRVPTEVHQRLAKVSPFVRIEGNLQRREPKGYDAKYLLDYNSANKRSMDILFVDHRNEMGLVRESDTSMSYLAQKVPQKFSFRIPLSPIDPRVQEVRLTVSVTNQSTALRMIGWRHLPLGSSLSTYPLGLHTKDVLQVNISTADLIALSLADLYPEEMAKQSLQFDFELVNGGNNANADGEVKFHLEVRNLVTRVWSHVSADTFPHSVPVPFLGTEAKVSKNSAHNPIQLSWSEWRYTRYDAQVLNASERLYGYVNHNYTILQDSNSTKALGPDTLRVERLILGSSGRFLGRHQVELHYFGHSTALAEEQIRYDELPPNEDYFRLGYLVYSTEPIHHQKVWLEHKFHRFGAEPNCDYVPTFAELPCGLQRFECLPGLFQYDPKIKACKPISPHP